MVRIDSQTVRSRLWAGEIVCLERLGLGVKPADLARVEILRTKRSRRKEFLVAYQTSGHLVQEIRRAICIEDLSVTGLARTKLAKSVLDAGLGEFRRQLEYKTIWSRRHLAVVDRFFPSSKTCHACGTVNGALTLADRSWTCVCGLDHDRDLNAALNIRSEGLKQISLAAGHAERLNARRPDVRLPQVGSNRG